MEEVRRKLERQVAADPSDERAAARLELMQIRSGMVPVYEGGNMVTTLLRQRVTLRRGGRQPACEDTGVIISVYVPTVGSCPILGKLRVLIQTDEGKFIDAEAENCSIPTNDE